MMVLANMKKNEMFLNIPAQIEQTLMLLGKNIRIARLRRNMRLSDMAERVGVSRYTMADIEKGKPSASMGSYMGALWVLGLIGDMRLIADPDRDIEGKALESGRSPKTAAKRKKDLDNDF